MTLALASCKWFLWTLQNFFHQYTSCSTCQCPKRKRKMCTSLTATPASRPAPFSVTHNFLKYSRIRATCRSLKWQMTLRCTSPTATPASWAAVNLLLVQLSPVQIIAGSGWAKFAKSQEHLSQLTFTFTSAIPDCTLVSCLITWVRSARYNRSLNHCFLFQITLKNYFAPLLPLPRRNSFVWCWWTPPLTRFPASMPASAVPTYSSDSTGPAILRSVASIIHL